MATSYRNVDHAIKALALRVMRGDARASRVGDTREITAMHFTMRNPLEREIVLPSRKANIAAQIAETMWVLSGRNDIEFLSHYLPRAAEFSDDGATWRAGYGPRLRRWRSGMGQGYQDQLENVVNLLLRDPETRRAVVSLWDPASDYTDTKDIPCNNWLHFLARDGVLDLHVAIRSNDLIWGWSGINQFEWSVLLEMIAAYTKLKVGRIHYSVSSLHVYDTYADKAEKLSREPLPNPAYAAATPRFVDTGEPFDQLAPKWFALERRIREDAGHGCTGLGCEGCYIASAVDQFPEPMLQSWLRVLQWWWTGDRAYLRPLAGTRLHRATEVALQPKGRGPAASDASEAQGPPSGRDLAAATLRKANPHTRHNMGAPCFQGCPGWEQPISSQPRCLRCEAPIYQDRGVWLRETTGSAVCPRNPAGGGHEPRPTISRDFIEDVCALHVQKDAAYGVSWKKRGEMFSILPNIARKSDRLGAGDTSDETQTDTAADLMVYLAKYRTWLYDHANVGPNPGQYREPGHTSDTPDAANDLLRQVAEEMSLQEQPHTTPELEAMLKDGVERLMTLAEEAPARYPDRIGVTEILLRKAYVLAERRWRETPTLFSHDGSTDYRGADRD